MSINLTVFNFLHECVIVLLLMCISIFFFICCYTLSSSSSLHSNSYFTWDLMKLKNMNLLLFVYYLLLIFNVTDKGCDSILGYVRY